MTARRDHNLLTHISDIDRQLEEYKTPQPAGGDSWIVYKNQTGNYWDIEGYAPTTSYTFRRFIIRLIPEHPERQGFAAMYEQFVTDSPDSPARRELIRKADEPYAWWALVGNFFVINGPNNQYHWKFYLYSTQKGTVEVEELT